MVLRASAARAASNPVRPIPHIQGGARRAGASTAAATTATIIATGAATTGRGRRGKQMRTAFNVPASPMRARWHADQIAASHAAATVAGAASLDVRSWTVQQRRRIPAPIIACSYRIQDALARVGAIWEGAGAGKT